MCNRITPAACSKNYGLSRWSAEMFYVLGSVQVLLILAFVTGSWKRISYGLIVLFHGISTLSSYAQYLDPFSNLLFFAAWPMWAACVALYLLREYDTRWTLGWGEKANAPPTNKACQS